MPFEPLPQFNRQLALWTEAVIARGRSPFRRAESHPPLLTASGEESPELVLWINRDSFMAGGILLLSPEEIEEAVPSGVRCAEALGLKHFGVWSPREIVLWECGGGRVSTIPAPPRKEPEAFRSSLETLLEHFKLRSVLGNVPPADLSPYFFANLARTAMEGAFPSLAEGVRIAQGEGRFSGAQSPHRLARRKTALTLLRLLALMARDALPPAVQPEGLERAMTFALDGLPRQLHRLLACTRDELPLPPEAAVRFHHLFRRLGQLQFGRDGARVARVLEILLANEGHRLGGHPIPDGPVPEKGLLINPDDLLPSPSAEVAPAPLLALTALIRDLGGIPSDSIQVESCFDLAREQMAGTVVGTFADRTLPPAEERLEMTARLRTSWPNRRFPLSPRTPRWVWELLHLLGLSESGTHFALHLPKGSLGADFAAPVLDILREHFTIDRLSHAAPGLRIDFRKEVDFEAETTFPGDAGERRLPWKMLCCGHRALIPLALDLPSPLFALLSEGVLKPFQAEDMKDRARQLLLYGRSSLGKYLWRVVGGGNRLPEFGELPEEGEARGWPIPPAAVLDHLSGIPEGDEVPSSALIDRELSRLLGVPEELPAARCDVLASRSAAQFLGSPRQRNAAEEIAGVVFADGIPKFPEQYLYDYYRPPLRSFSFGGPLKAEGAFFGQMTLRDAEGTILTVEGEETARALIFASYSGRTPVDLPQDRRLTAAILDRYCSDLRHLRQVLLRECHLRVPKFRSAEALAERIWKSRHLPPWSLVEE